VQRLSSIARDSPAWPGWAAYNDPPAPCRYGRCVAPVNLLKAASTVSLLTLLSRVTGLVREQLIAASFGASAP
jgi:hypothetical protein